MTAVSRPPETDPIAGPAVVAEAVARAAADSAETAARVAAVAAEAATRAAADAAGSAADSTQNARLSSLESGQAWPGWADRQEGWTLQIADDLTVFWGPGGAAPVTADHLLTEGGDFLTTEAGDLLVLEA
jgi:hypothetical protein